MIPHKFRHGRNFSNTKKENWSEMVRSAPLHLNARSRFPPKQPKCVHFLIWLNLSFKLPHVLMRNGLCHSTITWQLSQIFFFLTWRPSCFFSYIHRQNFCIFSLLGSDAGYMKWTSSSKPPVLSNLPTGLVRHSQSWTNTLGGFKSSRRFVKRGKIYQERNFGDKFRLSDNDHHIILHLGVKL